MREHFILALPIALAGTTVYGSTIVACCVCAAEVWLAPTSRAILAQRPDRRVICVECAKTRPGIILPPTPAQNAEIAAHRARN